ncbi:4Fe-4S dicluster domain-containing protein [Desulfovibrio litoralis]|uniref:4Fe-4S dicluster domain-containing protein n=1 Tax=Desulfovibrio litoralis DSM 11393 TaxID=1121455 RepID=A0A1M7T8T9_9BACT|nr:4Fe-4S dicluster domain-containing protein [Desulfovibrio litoralis]SHN67092.1 4Fe-4S dicluster domain-containing protein [Desulfovibrio litoralis DSM 11393]
MSVNELIKEKIRQILPEVKLVMAWGKGYDALHSTPLFIESEKDLDKLEIGPCSVQNLASYLLDFNAQNIKVGIVVKGCDSRSVVAQIQETLVKRENVVIIGFPCDGVIDLSKVESALPKQQAEIQAVDKKGDELIIKLKDSELKLNWDSVRANRCASCAYPNAIISDHFVGIQKAAQPSDASKNNILAVLEAKSPAELMEFWKKEMERCIRCYACRNACPLCACKEHCVAQSREPHWLSQEDSVTDKWFFQVIHATHLAGRCTGCGECQRACPMNIPVGLFKMKFNSIIKELFDYEAGVDIDANPPLQTFSLEEKKIKERNW